jgi:peptidoglycan hydrolase-like protein with peptidoglycan-binding domain
MRNLYRFNEFLLEGKSIGDFTEDFMTKMEGVEKTAKEVKKKLEEEKKDPTFEFKDKPLEKGDSRKDWVKKIQDVFVNKKIQEKVDSKNYGSFGPNTETAVKAYQKEKGKEETGKVDNELMKLILKDLEDIEKEKKKNDTPFKDKEEGNAFRKWVREKDKSYADKIKLDETGDYNNSTIQEAWKKYGEDYKKEKDKK